jgi:hypothetical protein
MLTVAELIAELQRFPGNALVVVKDNEMETQREVTGAAVVDDRSWLKGIGPDATVVELELI